MPSHRSATGASAGQGGVQRGPDAVPVLVRLVQPVRVRRDHLPGQPDLEPCPQREQRQHVQPALAGLPGFLLVLHAPGGGPGDRRRRRAGQLHRPVPGDGPAAALGGLRGRVDVIPAHRDRVRRATGPDAQHGQVGEMPAPGRGDLDAPGLLPAEGGQHELGLGVGVAGQPELPGLPADDMPARPHGTRASHGGSGVNHASFGNPVTTGTSSAAAAWRGPRPTGRGPVPRPSPRGGSAAAPAAAGWCSPGRPGDSGPGGRRATGRRCP